MSISSYPTLNLPSAGLTFDDEKKVTRSSTAAHCFIYRLKRTACRNFAPFW